MTQESPSDRARFLLEPAQRRRHAQQLMRDFEVFLAPGERLDVQVEFASTFRLAQLKLYRPDRQYELTLEASMMQEDQQIELADMPGEAAIESLLAFLNIHLYEFFRSDRTARFHVDWKIYPFEGVMMRFRAQSKSPKLEEEADALLDSSNTLSQ